MATANMILRTWTGAHDAVVHYDPESNSVVKVVLTRGGAERDITEQLDDDTLAMIEAQLLALAEDAGLDLEAAEEAQAEHDTGEPDIDASGVPDGCDEVSRGWLEDEQREASE